MAIRLGIELSPVASRIVAIDAPRAGRTDSDTHVKFATTVRAGRPAQAAFASLRGRRASVVVWAPRVDHRQVVVADGPYEQMQAEARAAVRDAGCSADRTLADIAPISRPDSDGARRTVLLACASTDDVASLIKPVTDAGIRIDRVLTPAAALLSLARARRRPNDRRVAPEAYVAIDETHSCLAFIRAGILLGAVNLNWGFVDEQADRRTMRNRFDIARRLGDDITTFMQDCRLGAEQIRHVCVCGGLPEIRSMAMTLMEQLDVEVEPLDSLFAIDEATLPGNASEFRDHAPALRLAWAAVADPLPPIDLFRVRRRQAWRGQFSRSAIAAGAVTGLLIGWAIQDRWQPVVAASSVQRVLASERREPSEPRADGSLVEGAQLGDNPEHLIALGSPADHPFEVVAADHEPEPPVSRPMFRAVREPVPLPPGVIPPFMVHPPVVTPVPIRPPISTPLPPLSPVTPTPTPGPIVSPTPVRPPVVTPQPVRPPVVSPVQVPRSGRQQSGPATPRESRTMPTDTRSVQETTLPFDATLDSILYGSDRRLALVDGRIVEPGDVVRGATVVEITTTAVMLRDDRGQLRRLTAGGGGR